MFRTLGSRQTPQSIYSQRYDTTLPHLIKLEKLSTSTYSYFQTIELLFRLREQQTPTFVFRYELQYQDKTEIGCANSTYVLPSPTPNHVCVCMCLYTCKDFVYVSTHIFRLD